MWPTDDTQLAIDYLKKYLVDHPESTPLTNSIRLLLKFAKDEHNAAEHHRYINKKLRQHGIR